MKYEYIIQEHHPRLLIFFAGWAADPTPFRRYRPEGRDYGVCYDYRTLETDLFPPGSYREADIVSWSMGVWAASHVVPRLGIPIGRSIALNGTPFPVDDRRGIHPDIWQGTLLHLSPANLHKFCRRMCADAQTFQDFLRVTPRRPMDELADEMRAIDRQRALLPAPSFRWTQAVVATRDRIIPPDNQQRAWHDLSVPVLILDDAHYSAPMFHHYLEDLWKSN